MFLRTLVSYVIALATLSTRKNYVIPVHSHTLLIQFMILCISLSISSNCTLYSTSLWDATHLPHFGYWKSYSSAAAQVSSGRVPAEEPHAPSSERRSARGSARRHRRVRQLDLHVNSISSVSVGTSCGADWVSRRRLVCALIRRRSCGSLETTSPVDRCCVWNRVLNPCCSALLARRCALHVSQFVCPMWSPSSAACHLLYTN